MPEGLNSLSSYAKSRGIYPPDVFVEIRNAIIHSHQDKRKGLREIPREVISDALRIGIWYVELVLLHLLNYKGKYYNRCSRKEEKFK